MQLEYRSYTPEDKDRILEIFDSNCPRYFDPNDTAELLDFLDNYADENYMVVVFHNRVIGCGGHFTKENFHGIAWTMFERGSLGHSQLLKVSDDFFPRVEQNILKEEKNYPVLINTTQLMEQLFNRYGFETYEIIKDGFGKGLDEYKMRKELTKRG